MSADGSVIVGTSYSASGMEAFRWTQAGGMVGLGDLTGGGFSSGASDVSADGSVIVGVSDSAFGKEAFLWTLGGGMVGLGDLAGSVFENIATGVSADGSVVVGGDAMNPGFLLTEAFIWDSTNGMRSLKSMLQNDYGLNMTGWTLEKATGVSADGKVIVGIGLNPDGDLEAWVANLSVPEPSTFLMLFTLVACGAVALHRRRN